MSGGPDPNRRTVLRRIGEATTAVGLLGGTAMAAGREEAIPEDSLRNFLDDATADVDGATRSELLGRYDDAAAIRAELEAATPVLDALAAAGHLDSASPSEFALDGVREGEVFEPADAGAGVGVEAVDHPEGASAHLSATTPSADSRVAIYRQPELDVTFAFVESGGERLVFHDVDDDVSTTKDCGWEFLDCTGSYCEFGDPPQCYEYQRYCCLMADGSYECSDTRYVCGCTCE